MMIKRTLTLPKSKYYQIHLSIINPLLPEGAQMTPKEIEVLAIFMSLDGDIGQDRFGTTAKKIVKEQLKLSDGGLGNYMSSFKNKQLIVLKEGKLQIQPLLMASANEQDYTFKLINYNG